MPASLHFLFFMMFASAGPVLLAAPDRLPAPPAAAAAEVVEAMRLVDAAIPAAAADQTRPAWHFRPPALWMNDICGAIFHDGWYHVFYQFNPRSPLPSWHADQTSAWGHARSRDLVEWEHLPIAIAAVGGEGELRCNSGCVALDDEGTPTIFNTYVPKPGYLPPADRGWRAGDRQQLIATSRDGLVTWQRSPKNPVVRRRRAGIPESFDRYLGWSDPFVFRAGGETFVTFKACGGLVCRAEAADFTDWSYAGRLTAADADDDDATPGVSEAGEPECPNLMRLGDRWLLVESGGGGSQQVRYRSSSLDPRAIQFHVAAAGIVDHAYGPKWPDDATRGFYGTNLVTAPDGRAVLLGWAGGFKPGRAWNSCMALPREISLDDTGHLLQSPAPELERLRRDHDGRRGFVIRDGSWRGENRGNMIEIDLVVADAARAAFAVELAAGSAAPTTIRVGPDSIALNAMTAPIDRGPGPTRRLRVFVDRTLVEVFVDGRTAITQEVPTIPADAAVAIVPAGDDRSLAIERLDIWSLCPIW
jgi:beta-fructofuranosidase